MSDSDVGLPGEGHQIQEASLRRGGDGVPRSRENTSPPQGSQKTQSDG